MSSVVIIIQMVLKAVSADMHTIAVKPGSLNDLNRLWVWGWSQVIERIAKSQQNNIQKIRHEISILNRSKQGIWSANNSQRQQHYQDIHPFALFISELQHQNRQ